MVDEGRFGDFVTTVTATDADMEAPTYSITGGEDSFRFNIDPNTGEVTFNQRIEFNQPGD